jgi:CRISPR-associated endonuclease/helicase Cas3
VQIVWRADISDEQGAEECEAILCATRPSTLESVTIPLAVARAWLRGRPMPMADVEATAAADEAQSRPDDLELRAFRWTGDRREWVDADSLLPGDVLVVPATRGGLGAWSFDPHDDGVVVDLADLAELRGRGVASLRLVASALHSWGLGNAIEMSAPNPVEGESSAELRGRITDWVSTWPTEMSSSFPGTEQEWATVRSTLVRYGRRPLIVAGHFILKAAVPSGALGRDPEVEDAVSEDDDSSFREQPVTLRRHSSDVRDYAERFARSVGLSEALIADIARAGWLHDVGKADPRFQRWLLGGTGIKPPFLDEPLAKSALPPGSFNSRTLAQERAGYPRGYRHELLSLAMIGDNEAALEGVVDRDLVLHLVASHHGWCRPFTPPIDHPDDFRVELDHDGTALSASTRHRFARLDSGVSDRFWRLIDRYGWWGLAWLEAVMRLADHRASEMEAGGAP